MTITAQSIITEALAKIEAITDSLEFNTSKWVICTEHVCYSGKPMASGVLGAVKFDSAAQAYDLLGLVGGIQDGARRHFLPAPYSQIALREIESLSQLIETAKQVNNID